MRRPGILLPMIFRHLLKKPFTLLYPRVQWPLPERYRGILSYKNDACIGCGICAKVCASEAIEMVNDPAQMVLATGRVRKKKPVFYLDRCMRCAQCEESCPQHAIHLQKRVGLVAYMRKAMNAEQGQG